MGDRNLLLLAAEVAAELDGSVKLAGMLGTYLAEPPSDPSLHQALIRVLLAAQKEEEALAVSEGGLTVFPEADSLALLKAEALHRLDRDDEARGVLWTLAEEGEHWRDALSELEALQAPPGRLYAVRGDRLRLEGREEPALDAFRRALDEDPRSVDALEGRARIFLAGGKEEAANEALLEALSIESTRATIWAMKATIEERRGEAEEAIRSLQVSLRYDPHNVEAVCRIGALLHDAGRDEEALGYYVAAAEEGNRDTAYLEGWRKVLGALGRWEDFRAVTRRLADVKANHSELLVDEARSWMETEETGIAEDLLTEFLDNGADGVALRHGARLAVRMEAWDLARRAGKRVLRENPGDREGFYILALALRGLERDVDALKVVSRGLRLYRDLDLLQLNREILRARGDFKARYRCCETILRVTPEAVDVYLEMATIAAARGKTRLALRVCERGLKAVPNDPDLGLKRAEVLYEEGRYGEAYRAYEALLQAEEGNADAWKGRGLSLYALKDFHGGAESFERAGELGDDPESWYYQGLCLLETGVLVDAQQAFDRATAHGGEGRWWLARGMCLQETGDTRDALYSFEQALEMDATLNRAKLQKAECLLDLEDARGALRSLADAPSAGRLGRDTLRIRIRCLEGLSEFQEAYEAACALTNAARADPGAWMLRARLACTLGLTTEARLSWAKASKLVPEDPAPKVEEATMLLESEDPSGALRLTEEALSLDRRNEKASVCRGRAFAALGNHEAAIRSFDDALALNLGLQEALRGKALSLARSDRLEEALRIADELESQNASDPQTYLWKARILSEGGRWEEALKSLNQALYYGGGAPEILAEKGLVLGELDRIDEGVNLLESATSGEPPEPALVAALATLLIRGEHYGAALEHLTSASLLGPVGRRVLLLRVEALGGLERWDEAMEALGVASRTAPIPAPTWVRLSVLYEGQGDGPAAVVCYDQALEADARNLKLWKGRGRLCTDLERWPEALESYEAAVEVAPEDGEALCGLGRAYVEADLFDEAQEAYGRALAANPASREAAIGRQAAEDRRHARRVETFSLRVLQFELTHGRPATKEEAFRYCDVPMEMLPDVLGYVNEPASLDILSLDEGEIRHLEARSREVLFTHEGEGLPRLAGVIHEVPEMSPPEARRVLEYIQGIVETDLPQEETPGLERLMKLAMELPETERNTLSLARELGVGAHRAKMVELALHDFEAGPPGQEAGRGLPGPHAATRCRKHGTPGIYQHLCGQYLCSACIVSGRCPICRHPVSGTLSQMTRPPEGEDLEGPDRY